MEYLCWAYSNRNQNAPLVSQYVEGQVGREATTKHHGAVAIAWSRALHLLHKRLNFLRRSRIYAILRLSSSLERIFRSCMGNFGPKVICTHSRDFKFGCHGFDVGVVQGMFAILWYPLMCV